MLTNTNGKLWDTTDEFLPLWKSTIYSYTLLPIFDLIYEAVFCLMPQYLSLKKNQTRCWMEILSIQSKLVNFA